MSTKLRLEGTGAVHNAFAIDPHLDGVMVVNVEWRRHIGIPDQWMNSCGRQPPRFAS
jgi:hypothetical protein